MEILALPMRRWRIPSARSLVSRGRERGVKGNRSIREGVTKADDLEMLGRVLMRRECRCNDEAETVIVTMIADEDAALGAVLAYRLKTRLDELAADTAPLQWRLDRHRTEGEPPLLRWGSYIR